MNNPYLNPGISQMQQFYPQQMQMTPAMLPRQQILRANGKDSIAALRMAPNSSVFVLDTTQPIIWYCETDSLGNVTSTPYDYAVHQDAPQKTDDSRLTAIEERLAALEAANV